MKVLIACEESQTVCKAFRERGHEAYSCDIQEPSGGHPEWHILGDALKAIGDGQWDMIIAHPPCTYLTVTGNRWYNVERYGNKAIQRYKDRDAAIAFFLAIANADCERIAIENPVGIMSTIWRKPDQIIEPWQYGGPYEKRTCLWLKGLPLLEPTRIVKKPVRKMYASGKSMPAWYADAWKLPPDERAKVRSRTFPGIAAAMAEQWGGLANE